MTPCETVLRDQEVFIVTSRLNVKVTVVGKFTPHQCFDKSNSFSRGDVLSPDINSECSVYDAVGGKEGA